MEERQWGYPTRGGLFLYRDRMLLYSTSVSYGLDRL